LTTRYDRKTLDCPDDEYCHYRYPKTLLQELSIGPDNYWLDFGVLVAMVVALRVLTYWALKKRLNSLNCK